jgi:aconitase B
MRMVYLAAPKCRQSKITVTVFKVTGRNQYRRPVTGAGCLEPPGHPAAHALAMLKNAPSRHHAEDDGKRGPVQFIDDLKKKGHLVAYVGDVVGTGSSRKSATNSVSVVHRRRHSLRAQQAFRWCVPGRQDRADLLQHTWKTPARCRSSST